MRDDTSLAGGRVFASSRGCGYQYASRGQKAAKGSECADVECRSWWAGSLFSPFFLARRRSGGRDGDRSSRAKATGGWAEAQSAGPGERRGGRCEAAGWAEGSWRRRTRSCLDREEESDFGMGSKLGQWVIRTNTK